MAIVENVQREDLNPVEVAIGYQRLMEEVGLTQEQVADKVGKSRPAIANVLRLLKLPPRVQASLRDGSLSPGHARALVTVEEEADQIALLRAVLDDGLSVREVERRVRSLREPDARETPATTPEPAADDAAPDAAPALSPRERLEIESIEDRLRSAVASQVAIRHRADGSGKIEVSYYSAADLERIVDRLLGR